MGFTVTRTSRSLVAPSSPTPAETETLSLSVLDRVAGRHLVQSLHVFEAGGGEPAREALEKALVEYHPFAGRFVEVVGADGSGEVAVVGVGRWPAAAAAAEDGSASSPAVANWPETARPATTTTPSRSAGRAAPRDRAPPASSPPVG